MPGLRIAAEQGEVGGPGEMPGGWGAARAGRWQCAPSAGCCLPEVLPTEALAGCP